MTDVDLDRLSSVQDAFDKASDTDPDPFALPEPGDYGATVDSFDIIDSSKGLLFKTTLTIINDQQYAGRQVDTIHNLEDQKRIDYLKSHLAKLGANTAGIRLAEDLRPGSDFLRGLLDVVVEIAIKDSKKVNPNTDSRTATCSSTSASARSATSPARRPTTSSTPTRGRWTRRDIKF